MTNDKFSRQRHTAVLKERKKAQLVDVKSHKRNQLPEQIEVITKKKDLMSAIENDIKPSDKFAMEAQLEKDFSVLHTPSL